MARIPTSYSSGINTAGRLEATNVPLTPLDAGQEIPRALAQFGQTLEKTMFDDLKMEQGEEYRQNIASFKEELATTQASLLKRKEELDNDANIPDAQKASIFSSEATAAQDKLFSGKPKHIVQDYKAQFIQMVTPIEIQVQNAAQAAMGASAQKQILLAKDQAQAEIENIASSGGPLESRHQLFKDYLADMRGRLESGLEGLSGKARQDREGEIRLLEQKANEHYQKILLKAEQDRARVSLADFIYTLKNSPSAATDPTGAMQSLIQAYGTFGPATQESPEKLRKDMLKDISAIWDSAAHKQFADADRPTDSLGAKLAADRALLAQLDAKTKAEDGTEVYTFGGVAYQQEDRLRLIEKVQNRIERNQNALRAEQARSVQKGPSGIDALTDPFGAAVERAKEKPVLLRFDDGCKSWLERVDQARRLGIDVMLTTKEANAVGNHLLMQPTPEAALKWMDTMTARVPPDIARRSWMMVAGQVSPADPATGRAIALKAEGHHAEALSYAKTKRVMKVDGSNPALTKDYNRNKEAVRTKLAGVLDTSQIEDIADVIATVTVGQGGNADKLMRNLVGTVVTTGVRIPFVPNKKMLVPPGYNADVHTNFFKNPNPKVAETFGTSPDIIKRSKVTTTPKGYRLIDNGEYVHDSKTLQPVLIPFDVIGGGR